MLGSWSLLGNEMQPQSSRVSTGMRWGLAGRACHSFQILLTIPHWLEQAPLGLSVGFGWLTEGRFHAGLNLIPLCFHCIFYLQRDVHQKKKKKNPRIRFQSCLVGRGWGFGSMLSEEHKTKNTSLGLFLSNFRIK